MRTALILDIQSKIYAAAAGVFLSAENYEGTEFR